jgi:hypothetical protein
MAETDPLAAEIAGIRERASQITGDHDPAECIADLGGPCSGHDAERLADAVERVLARHQPRTVTVREMCLRHASGAWDGVRTVGQQFDACPDCTKREQVECTGCNPLCPDDNRWPCEDVRVITRELLAKEATDG